MNAGTVCVIVDSPCLLKGFKYLVGKDCTVLGAFKAPILQFFAKRAGAEHEVIEVEIPGLGKLPMCKTCLRPKPTKDEARGDWNEIQRLTGWHPFKVWSL